MHKAAAQGLVTRTHLLLKKGASLTSKLLRSDNARGQAARACGTYAEARWPVRSDLSCSSAPRCLKLCHLRQKLCGQELVEASKPLVRRPRHRWWRRGPAKQGEVLSCPKLMLNGGSRPRAREDDSAKQRHHIRHAVRNMQLLCSEAFEAAGDMDHVMMAGGAMARKVVRWSGRSTPNVSPWLEQRSFVVAQWHTSQTVCCAHGAGGEQRGRHSAAPSRGCLRAETAFW